MTALAGVFGPAAESSAAAVSDMLAVMGHRASGVPESFSASEALLVAARHDWEATLNGWSGSLMAADDQWVVAADATLYYLDDLRRRLRAVPKDAGTGELLLLALRAWGPRFARFIEGDYAIVAWERQRGRLLLARDFGGRRPLAYAVSGGSVILASDASAVTRHPMVSAEYDVAFIAASSCAVTAHGQRTAYRDVAVVPGGGTLSIEGARVTEVDRWTPPPIGSGWESEPSAEGAEQLRALLMEATRQRIDPDRPTTVWMSGGWDSTAVFASGRFALGPDQGAEQRLLPISITYPADDPGNEDEHIRAIAEHWRTSVRWIDSDQVSLYADSARRVRQRDDPWPQPFEPMLRALSQQSRALKSRVTLEGTGGDHLFLASGGAILADHLFYGRWPRLWERWQTRTSARDFARNLVLPHLSPSSLGWIGAMRGRSLRGYWERPLPEWIIPSPAVIAETVPEFERLPGEGAAEFECRSLITTTLVARALSWNHAIGLDEGVLPRGPFLDTRVVAFAVARPLTDRGSGGDGKRILRRAMAGLLPDSVLAARARKTGTPAAYFRRQLAKSLQSEILRLFSTRRSNLERLGLLDRQAFLAAAETFARNSEHAVGGPLYRTAEAERWLTAREGTQ